MNLKLLVLGLAALFATISAISTTQAHAQDGTLGDLKAKGAMVLSVDELKALLAGAQVRYESPRITQMKLDPTGSIAGSSQNRVAASPYPITFGGKWRISDNAQWCVAFQFRGGSDEPDLCRSVLKIQDKYYLIRGAPRNDAQPVFEMSVSK